MLQPINYSANRSFQTISNMFRCYSPTVVNIKRLLVHAYIIIRARKLASVQLPMCRSCSSSVCAVEVAGESIAVIMKTIPGRDRSARRKQS